MPPTSAPWPGASPTKSSPLAPRADDRSRSERTTLSPDRTVMRVTVYPSADRASRAAADVLAGWLADTRTLVVAGGNSPRELYRLVAERRPAVDHLHVFALDEYLGVPV